MNAAQIGAGLAKEVTGSEMMYAEAGHGYMARSATHKLLLCRDDSKSQFFSLRDDPLELTNLYREAEAAPLVAEHKQALMNWSLFDAPARPFLDIDAAM